MIFSCGESGEEKVATDTDSSSYRHDNGANAGNLYDSEKEDITPELDISKNIFLLRRLSIDLLHRLPTIRELYLLRNQDLVLDDTVDFYLNSLPCLKRL